MFMPCSNEPIESSNLILFKLLVGFFENGNLTICDIILDNLKVHFPHNILNLLIKQLPIDFGLLKWLNFFNGRINFLVTVALSFLLRESKHFLVVPYKLIKTISLVLVKRPIVPIVILDFLVENCLENRFRLPRALAIGETFPFN